MSRSHAYPQVEPRAAGTMDATVAAVSRKASTQRALAVARLRDAAAVAVGDAYVLRADLAHAAALGLQDLPAMDLARPLPVVEARVTEVAVRRHLGAGAPLVIVRDGGRPVGAVSRRSVAARDDDGVPMVTRVSSLMSPAAIEVLTLVGQLAAARGARAFLVGGVVRDLLRAPAVRGRDIDVVVEGNGLQVARDLADRRGGRLVEHQRFLTASVEGGAAVSDGVGRVDIATARTERYDERGALPRVAPASLRADLGRRDFTVNTMAIELGSGRFGLIDPFGGRADLAAGRLRALHPLSFVDDPTRIFRGARYAVRLGLTHEAWSAAAQRLALRLVPYARLSGQRIIAELDHIVAEPGAACALDLLGRTRAFRLLDGRYRFTRLTVRRLRRLNQSLQWAGASGLDVRPLELVLAALLADQTAVVAGAALRRLAVTGDAYDRLERVVTARLVAVTLRPGRAPSARARLLRGLHDLELTWLHLVGTGATRTALDWFVERGRWATPCLRGNDLLALGVPRGPAVARMLERLTAARLDGLVQDAAGERSYVRKLLERDGKGAATEAGHAAYARRGEE